MKHCLGVTSSSSVPRSPIQSKANPRRRTNGKLLGSPLRPDHREIDTEGSAARLFSVDSWRGLWLNPGCVDSLGEKAIEDCHFRREIGPVLAGAAAGRTSEGEITLYSSLGTGLQDLPAARLLIDLAHDAGIGTEIDPSR